MQMQRSPLAIILPENLEIPSDENSYCQRAASLPPAQMLYLNTETSCTPNNSDSVFLSVWVVVFLLPVSKPLDLLQSFKVDISDLHLDG